MHLTRRATMIKAGVVTAGSAALLVALSSAAFAASSTTVTPAGDYLTASLAAGTTADFAVGSTTVSCNTSTTAPTQPLGTDTNNQIPAVPGNSNSAGPVGGPLNAPTFNSDGGACSTNVVFTTASTTTNSTNGSWQISEQYDPNGSTGTMTIPQGGVVTTISGLASCTITVAPNGPATVTGTYANGSPSTLTFSGVSVPISVTGGFGCPTASTSASFSATYDVTDASNPATSITVGP